MAAPHGLRAGARSRCRAGHVRRAYPILWHSRRRGHDRNYPDQLARPDRYLFALKEEVEAALAPVDPTIPGQRRRFDIVHFAGHAVFPNPDDPDARGYLVFAGKPFNYTVPLGTFAQWLARAGVRMVYLSCCSGSAARATLDLADNLVPMALGFSWDLEGLGAVRFAQTFYTSLLANKLKVCTAFQETKTAMYRDHRDGDPIWAAPVLVTQPNDWSRVELCLGN
jgi:hypothetical protein